MKRLFKFQNLKFLMAGLVPLLFMFNVTGLDNDSWYILAEGREIVNNGIYYTDTLSMHEGLDVTVQNYGFAVLFYWVFEMFGGIGIFVVLILLNYLVCYLLYKIFKLISDGNTNLSLALMAVTDLLLSLWFVVTRAQMVSYVIFLLLIYILELYIKTNRVKYLWWIPLLSLVQINLHASLWWMIFIVMGVYIVDSIGVPKFKRIGKLKFDKIKLNFLHLEGYRTKPLVIVALVAFAVGLINPYGVKMISFIFTSYGDETMLNIIMELIPYNVRGLTEKIIYLGIVVAIILMIYGKKENVRVRHLLMFFGFLALGLNTMKGMSHLILVMLLPVAMMYKDYKIRRLFRVKIHRMVMSWIATICGCLAVVLICATVPFVKSKPFDGLVRAMDIIDATNEDKVGDVYSGFDWGGYVEYRGYRAYIDPRAEVFLKVNNGKEDLLKEWKDYFDGNISQEEFLAKYGFEYLLVWREDPMYELNSAEYKMIFNEDDSGVRVFQRKNRIFG